MDGLDAITMERREQMEGWDSQHDDMHSEGELVRAAECYLLLARHQVLHHAPIVDKMMKTVPKEWPWDNLDWHPSLIIKNNLRKAGALLVAEWDRLDRMGA